MQSLAYIPASNGAANPSLMTVQTVRAPGATTITTNTVSGAPTRFYATMGQPHTFTDPVTGEVITIVSDATAVDFAGTINAGKIDIVAIAPGYTDTRGSQVGDVVIIRPITEWANNLFNILSAEHKDNGMHGNITVDSILYNTSFQDPANQSLYQNAIINGGCLVAQRAVPNLSTAYQYGTVDRFAAKATGTAVSAGTINRLTTGMLAATKGYDLQIAGATITGTGVVFLRYRMESNDARMFINAAASFGVRVYHNVGSAVNYTVFIRKANAVDNFTATTDIANSGAISVPNATATWLKFENINAGSLGDVTNGIEIEIQISAGAITTKNFNFGEFTFNKGAKAAAWAPRPYQQELAACLRYLYSLTNDNGAVYISGIGSVYVGASTSWIQVATPVPLRTTPTLTAVNLGVRYGGADFPMSSMSIANLFNSFVNVLGTTTGTGNGNSGVGYIAPSNGKLIFDAEL